MIYHSLGSKSHDEVLYISTYYVIDTKINSITKNQSDSICLIVVFIASTMTSSDHVRVPTPINTGKKKWYTITNTTRNLQYAPFVPKHFSVLSHKFGSMGRVLQEILLEFLKLVVDALKVVVYQFAPWVLQENIISITQEYSVKLFKPRYSPRVKAQFHRLVKT
jgi:hypothetical protein